MWVKPNYSPIIAVRKKVVNNTRKWWLKRQSEPLFCQFGQIRLGLCWQTSHSAPAVGKPSQYCADAACGCSRICLRMCIRRKQRTTRAKSVSTRRAERIRFKMCRKVNWPPAGRKPERSGVGERSAGELMESLAATTSSFSSPFLATFDFKLKKKNEKD